ncbi:MAG: Histidine kinase [Bacteroidota bacterium]|jgi:signal transduction histidine kinase
MNIRQRILVYFSALSISVIGFAFLLIFTVFSNYRREEYQQRIKDHTLSTITELSEAKQLNQNVLQSMNALNINKLYHEKTLLFNGNKQVIYSSLNDTKISFSADLLHNLSPEKPVLESREGDTDVVGVYFVFNKEVYYGITKAYDVFGYSKLEFLKYTLLVLFGLISALILISSFALANQISKPIISMAAALKIINMETANHLLPIPETKDEIYLLTSRFNELMKRLQDSFSFQKHAVHHISHELKTPISILVSNLERLEKESDPAKIKTGITEQKEDTKLLGDMINALLEIAKVETHSNLTFQEIRMDELVFDWVSELKKIHPKFKFDVQFDEKIESVQGLSVQGNLRLLKMVIQNLLLNCVNYASDHRAQIYFRNQRGKLLIQISNKGKNISIEEVPFLFQHFFRGENSQGRRGFGLGLVLVNKIIQLHGGEIQYESPSNALNKFTLFFPLGK